MAQRKSQRKRDIQYNCMYVSTHACVCYLNRITADSVCLFKILIIPYLVNIHKKNVCEERRRNVYVCVHISILMYNMHYTVAFLALCMHQLSTHVGSTISSLHLCNYVGDASTCVPQVYPVSMCLISMHN